MAVVKSNAYGHGIQEIAREAVQSGVDCLAIARVDEGIELRRSGITAPVVVFEVASPMQIETALRENLEMTVVSVTGAKLLDEASRSLRRKTKVHVKVDTGMARLGLPYTTAAKDVGKIAMLAHLELNGIYSHFATAEDPDASFAREQLGRFQSVLAELHAAGIAIPHIHMANSAAVMLLPEAHFTMVRCGLMLYGYAPRRGMEQEKLLTPVMSLVSRVAQLKTVPANTSISYGRRFVTRKSSLIASIPVGYADGFSRALTNKGTVLIRGQECPVVGTVCMDHLMADVSSCDGVKEDDSVTVLGANGERSITAWDLAEMLGTIPYEVTCGISARVPRILIR
jgi:alanine racemase